MIILEKYKGAATRYTCPKCGRKRCFTRYINTDNNQYINNNVGICNHIQSCGYHFSPKEFFGENKEFKVFNVPKVLNHSKELKPIHKIDKKIMLATLGNDSYFMEFLRSRFPEQWVDRVRNDYMICGDKNKRVIFWQIDEYLRLRTGKIMAYDPITGKRLKEDNLKIKNYNLKIQPLTWVHSELKKAEILDKDWQLTQCLFGLHLIRKYPEKPVFVVESEKTAVIMSILKPKYLWLATGGLSLLSWEKIWAIRDRQIRLFPDLGCFEKWESKAKEIEQKIGVKMVVDDFVERYQHHYNLKQGDDLADIFKF